jgi:hypothetical protein
MFFPRNKKKKKKTKVPQSKGIHSPDPDKWENFPRFHNDIPIHIRQIKSYLSIVTSKLQQNITNSESENGQPEIGEHQNQTLIIMTKL